MAKPSLALLPLYNYRQLHYFAPQHFKNRIQNIFSWAFFLATNNSPRSRILNWRFVADNRFYTKSKDGKEGTNSLYTLK